MGTFETFTDSMPPRKRSIFLACEGHCSDKCNTRGACAYSKAISVLNPIADAVHLVHGPVECATCATYAWNARGSISSGQPLCGRQEIIFFDEKRKLAQVVRELAAIRGPKAVFVYSTCKAGADSRDIGAVCKSASKDARIPVLPVSCTGLQAERGYDAACNALLKLIGTRSYVPRSPCSVNILGDYNIAGDLWSIRSYFEEIGIEVVSTLTGDSRVAEIQSAHLAGLNLVQCSSSMNSLAKRLYERYGIPYRQVSFLGLADMSSALRTAAEFFEDPSVIAETEDIISRETRRVQRLIEPYKGRVAGKRAAIYLNGAAKAASLINALNELGIEVVMVGVRHGDWVDRQRIRNLIGSDAVSIDGIDPSEMRDSLIKSVDLIIPGIKEQFAARNFGIPFCDICHNRTSVFEGFDGMVNFAREIDIAVNNRTERLPARRKTRLGRPPCISPRRDRL
jgi:nitrogenase molybdenum-cofactor synthesis protein NifE